MTFRTRFDGEKIVLPRELRGHAPCPVEISIAEDRSTPERPDASAPESVWSVVARAPGGRSDVEILREIATERDAWETQ